MKSRLPALKKLCALSPSGMRKRSAIEFSAVY